MAVPRPEPYPSEAASDAADRGFTSRWPLVWGGAIFVAALLARFGVVRAFGRGSAGDESIVGQGLGALVAVVISAMGYLAVTSRIEHRPAAGLRGAHKLRDVVAGVLIGSFALSVGIGLIALLGGYRSNGLHDSPQIIVPVLAAVGAAVTEELFFRGWVQRLLDEWLGSWAGLLVAALFFGLMHMANAGVGVVGAVGITLQAGLLLGATFLATRRLWAGMGLHWAWNFLQGGVFSYPHNGAARDGLLEAATHGSAWLTGGSAGLEGAILPTGLNLVIAAVLLGVARRRGNLRPAPVRVRSDGSSPGAAGT